MYPYSHFIPYYVSAITHTHTLSLSLSLIPFEDHELTGLKADTAVSSARTMVHVHSVLCHFKEDAIKPVTKT